MNNEEGKVRLDALFEYLIFFNKPAYVQKGIGDDPFKIYVKGYDKDNFKAELTLNRNGDKISIAKGQGLLIKSGYNTQVINFNSQIVDKYEKGNKIFLTFTRPSKGIVSNLRPSRLSFVNNSDKMRIAINIQSQNNVNRNIESNKVFNLSPEAIAFNVNRKQGLILPGDIVESFKVYFNDKVVIESSGEIIKVVQSEDKSNNMFVVMEVKNKSYEEKKKDDLTNNRNSERFDLSQHLTYIDAEYPLAKDQHIYGHVADISKLGISIMLSQTKLPIMAGMILPKVYLQFPYYGRIHAAMKILNCTAITNNKNYSYKIGAELVNLSNDLVNIISIFKQNYRDNRYYTPKPEDSEEIMTFFFETRFIYPEKRERIQKYSAQILETHKKMLIPSSVTRTILLKDGNTIVGHHAGIKSFDNSWMVHHLCAGRTHSDAARVVLEATTDYYLDAKVNMLLNNNYVTTWYRANNLFSVTVFDELRNLMNDPIKCNTEDFKYCTLKSKCAHNITESDYKCEEAGKPDLIELEKLLIRQNFYEMIKVESLSYNEITNMKISKEFKKIGLYRERRVFIIKDKSGEGLAYGVCNYASIGMNLTEFTNSFKIYCRYPGDERNNKIATILTGTIIDTYKATKMYTPIFLQGKNTPLPAQFEVVKTYRFWYVNGKNIPLFKEKKDEIFDNFKFYLKKYNEIFEQEKNAKQ